MAQQKNTPAENACRKLLAYPEGLPPERLARAAMKLKGKVPAALATMLMRRLLAADERFEELPDGRWTLADTGEFHPLSDSVFTVVDLETTGGRPAYNRVIQIGAFHVCRGKVLDSYMTSVNPGRKIPLQISYLTGIYDEHVAKSPKFREVAEPLVNFIGDTVFVAHNAMFDYGFVNAELARLGKPPLESAVLCTVRLTRRLLGKATAHNLGDLSKYLDIDLTDERHTAHGDAWATALVLIHCLELLEAQGIDTMEALARYMATPPHRRKAK